ncbi:MAG TPA: alpha/beta hydrolase family protein [Kofleriaceae bacterium]|nr:alpha/beta hydrolase family protein [Kofleriaceae bacterium]
MKPASLALALALAACAHPSTTPPAPNPLTTNPGLPGADPNAGGAGTPSHVVTERFHSDALGVDKNVVVYLPRGYDAQPGKRWPVFYYLHGLGGTETNWTKHGQLDQVADQLGLAAIVVMPDGDAGFYLDSPSTADFDACMKDGVGIFPGAHEPREAACVHKRAYETYIASDLVHWVDTKYRTIARRDGRAIAGLSMGGFGAMSISLRHPDEFAAAASHSGAIALLYTGPHPYAPGKATFLTDPAAFGRAVPVIGPWMTEIFGPDLAAWRAHDVLELVAKLPPGKVALYFDCGTEDDFRLNDNLLYVHDTLTANHIDHAFFEGPGKHDFTFWTARLPESLKFLTAHTAQPE